MQKQMRLTYGMALLFLVTFVSFGAIIIYQKGNLFLYPKIEKKLSTYFDTHYQDIQDEVIKSDLAFSIQDKSYFVTYSNKKHKDLSFQLIYTKQGKVKTTYQKDYIEGRTLLNKSCGKMEQELKKILKETQFSTYKVEIKKSLDLLTKSQKKKVLSSDFKEVPFYQVVLKGTIKQLDANEMANQLKDADLLLQEEHFVPISYTARFMLTEDHTKGLEIKNITRLVLQQEKLPEILASLHQTGKTKDEQSQIEMEEF